MPESIGSIGEDIARIDVLRRWMALSNEEILLWIESMGRFCWEAMDGPDREAMMRYRRRGHGEAAACSSPTVPVQKVTGCQSNAESVQDACTSENGSR